MVLSALEMDFGTRIVAGRWDPCDSVPRRAAAEGMSAALRGVDDEQYRAAIRWPKRCVCSTGGTKPVVTILPYPRRCPCCCPEARRDLAVCVRPPVPGGRREDQADAGSTRGTELRALPGAPEGARDRERAPGAVATDRAVLQPALVRVPVYRRARWLRVASQLVAGPRTRAPPAEWPGALDRLPGRPRYAQPTQVSWRVQGWKRVSRVDRVRRQSQLVLLGRGLRLERLHVEGEWGPVAWQPPWGWLGISRLHVNVPVWQMFFLSCMRAKVLLRMIAFMALAGFACTSRGLPIRHPPDQLSACHDRSESRLNPSDMSTFDCVPVRRCSYRIMILQTRTVIR